MNNAIKVGELKRQLASIPDDWDLTFGGVLDFARIKTRGDKLVDIEFGQIIYRKANGEIVLEDPGQQ